MKTALITGANRGLGLETACQLGRLGYRILLTARDGEKLNHVKDKLAKEGMLVESLVLDVVDTESIDTAVEQYASRFDCLDVLVNNAGVLDYEAESGPSTVAVDSLKRTFEINFFGVVAVTQAFLPLIKKSAAGRIVNVSSCLGSLAEHSDPNGQVHHARLTGYDCSKAALNLYTVELAQELEPFGIKVNAAHPGHVKTDMGGENAPLDIVTGAETSVWLATLPDGGPSGGFFHRKSHLRW